MKKSVNVVALLVFVATNVFTPFSYAVDDENQISPTDILILSKISEPLIVDDEENVGGEEKDIGGEETEKPNVSVETQNNEDGDLEGNKLEILEELKEIVIDPLLMLDRTEEEIVDDSEEITDDMDEEVSESREIYGTGEHKNVKVEVYAETGAFEETPILVIEPLESEKETEIKKAILTYNEDTEELDEEEIEEVAEEKIIEVVAFDIKFLDKEENEVQPKEGMVKVEFNFTENEILEETEEHEVKVYHLNDKDEEGNTIDEIKDMEIDEPELTENKEVAEEKITEEDNEEQIVTVVGDKFSIYTIVQQVKEEGPLAENENQLANFEYGEISIADPNNPGSGFTIMDRNLGALEAGTGNNSKAYGYHYQWGNNYGFNSIGDLSAGNKTGIKIDVSGSSTYSGNQFVWGESNSTWMSGSNNNDLWNGENRQGPCPDGWHVPTIEEWNQLLIYYAGYYTGNNMGGVSLVGDPYKYVSKNNFVSGFYNYFQIPFAGGRSYLDSSVGGGDRALLWSSTPRDEYAHFLILLSSPSLVGANNNSYRAYGLSVRCFKDTYSGIGDVHTITFNFNGGSGSTASINVVSGEKAIEPSEPVKEGYVFDGWYSGDNVVAFDFENTSITGDITLTAKYLRTATIVGDDDSRKIFKYGTIQIGDYVLMDRNLGAKKAWDGITWEDNSSNYGTDNDYYGYYYQWGNNWGFSDKTTSVGATTTITVPDEYIPSKYQGSGWNSAQPWSEQNNLWGDDADTEQARQGPCPDGWHVPSSDEWNALVVVLGDTGSNGKLLANALKLPPAGYRNLSNLRFRNAGDHGRYWSSSPKGTNYAYSLRFYDDTVYPQDDYYRSHGVPVRCFMNSPVPQTYTLTFDATTNGGTDATTGSIELQEDETINLGNYTGTRAGYTFVGWNINSGAHEGMDSITVTGDVTLYAIFSKEMTSNFVLRDSNAASLDETTASCTAYNGGYCIVTAPTLTKKSGYTVDGWSADEGNEITTIFTGGNTFNSVTHYDVPVSITFYQNGNGGTGYEVRTCYKYNGAGSCKITSPSISVSEGFIVQGWSDSPDYHGSSWYANSEADKYYDESYYAQAYLPVSVTFLANNNSVDGGSYAERYCTRYNGDKCYVTTPTIASVGSNTPEVVGYTLSADGVSSADIESNSGLYISGRETYYAHTKKSKVTLVAKWDGNNSTLSSYEDSDCELPEVYDGAAQISGCTVSAPVITAPEATPIVIGFNTGENATTNSDSYNTGNGKLFLTENSHNQTWYAITYMSGKVLTIDYSIGAGVYSIGKNSDSCTLTGTYNGIAQASSCTVKAPTITVNSGYSDTSKKWTDLSTSSQVAEGEDIILTKDLHYTASAQYQSSTIPETYTITYELNGGTISGEKLVYTVEDPTFTLVNPTWEHHIFAGWTGAGISDPQLVVTISQGTKFENLTYYANWYGDFNDNGINDAIESHFLVKYTDGVDGETVFEDQIFNEVLSGLATPLFVGIPERAGYDFLGWSPEVSELVLDDVEYVARWNKQSSGGGNSSGGGGKRLPTVDTHGAAEDEKASSMDENKEAEEKSETEDSQTDNQDQTKNNDGENSQGEDEPDYPDEFVDAYSFSRINGITTVEKIQDAKMYGNLTRIEMAKMLSNYAINVLGKKPDTSKTIKFKDVTNKMDKKYDNGVLLSYQLGIMGINVKNKKFRPNDLVTRAEFATALSRTLFGGEEGKYKSTRKYYEPHIAKLYNEGIINNTDPNMKEKRGYVMIMLMRSVGVK